MSDEEMSAFERYHSQEDGAVRNIELFYETTGEILGKLLDDHSIPSGLPVRWFMGSVVSDLPHLADIFYRTLDFLEDEGLIRRMAATPRSLAAAAGKGEPPIDPAARYSLTLKGLSLLSLRPNELFPETLPNQTLGEKLTDALKMGGGEAKSQTIRQLIAWGIGQFGRAIGI